MCLFLLPDKLTLINFIITLQFSAINTIYKDSIYPTAIQKFLAGFLCVNIRHAWHNHKKEITD